MSTPLRLALAVGLGSGLGAVARWLLAAGFDTLGFGGSPLATLAANVLGSLAIGLVAAQDTRPGQRLADPALRQFLMAGFCGGLTTFSIFSLETLRLAQGGAPGLAILYVALSLGLWLGAVAAGFVLGRKLARRPLPPRPRRP